MIINDAKVSPLKEIVTISAGYPFRGRIKEIVGSGIRVIQMRDVSLENGVSWVGCIEVEVIVKKENDWLRLGDILFAARGNTPYAFCIDRLPSQPSMLLAAPHFFVVRTLDDSILPEYLAWFLNQRPAQKYFARSSEGTTTKSVRREVLEDVEIVVPSLEKQQQIIALNDTIRRERKCLHQLIQNGEKTLTSVANNLVKRGGE